jgi:NAD(P)-dependent dehydrogenase (short-subunit alcohol dehydrogenase family)
LHLAQEGHCSYAPRFRFCDLKDVAELMNLVREIENEMGAIGVLANNAANDDRHTLEDILGRPHGCKSSPSVFLDPVGISWNERSRRWFYHQHEFDRLANPFDRIAPICHCEGSGRRANSNPRA